MFRSDILFLEVAWRDQPVCILAGAQRGRSSSDIGRGLFPSEILKKVATSSSGGMYCWPPRQR